MTIGLRPAQRNDLRSLHALDKLCFREGISYTLAEMKYLLTQEQSISIVAENEAGTLAGFVMVEIEFKGKASLGHVVTIDVDPSFRRAGVGRLLMQEMESQLLRQGALGIHLEVAVDNESAQQFYRNLGYVAVGRIPKYYLGRLDALVMEKFLAAE